MINNAAHALSRAARANAAVVADAKDKAALAFAANAKAFTEAAAALARRR